MVVRHPAEKLTSSCIVEPGSAGSKGRVVADIRIVVAGIRYFFFKLFSDCRDQILQTVASGKITGYSGANFRMRS